MKECLNLEISVLTTYRLRNMSNYLCFIALSVEVFSIMFVYGLIKSVVAVLLVDTVALIGILIVGITKVSLGHSPAFKS